MPATVLTLDELEAHCRRQGALSPQTGLRLIAATRRGQELAEAVSEAVSTDGEPNHHSSDYSLADLRRMADALLDAEGADDAD